MEEDWQSGQQHQGSSTRAASEESSRAPKLLLAITFDWGRGGRFRGLFGLTWSRSAKRGCQRVAPSRPTPAAAAAVERTLDPYINLDLIQNFEIVLPSSS